MSNIEEYTEAQRVNFAAMKASPHFKLISLTDELYGRTYKIVAINSVSTYKYARFMLLGHQSLLAAASLIGQCQPMDAAAITRRAIEMTRIAFAIKHDKRGWEKWVDYTGRAERWASRQIGERPKPLVPIKYDIPDHPLIKELMDELGSLSDGYIHFTPEYYASQNWREVKDANPPRLELIYFISDVRVVERDMFLLAAVHLKMLLIFDECLDHALVADNEWKAILDGLVAEGEKLKQTLQMR
ncbi:MAG: hypothetical protein A3F90_07445 [Deltaproteobacteria bacterium RIFCSPLOWO2_12_FULL_60_19]|nr:MAG: hypothetical protein A3F90_07445 [Deltaproteobacteria bacterium RIFCSPLOWO2_12_FULL_60_19]